MSYELIKLYMKAPEYQNF